MEYLISIILIILSIITFFKTIIIDKDSILNPKFIFTFLWTIIMMLYSFHLFDLYQTDFKYILLILIGVFSFFLGCCIIEKNQKYLLNICDFSLPLVLRRNFISILGIICIIFFMKNFIISIYLIIQGNSFEQIRLLAQDSSSILNQANSVLNFVKNFIVLPSATAIEIIAVVDYWFDKKKISLIFVINIIIIALRVISDGGRTPLFNFFVLMISGYIFSKHINNEKIIIDFKFKIITVLSFISLLMISFARSGSLLLRHIYLYFSMSPYLFGFWGNVVDQKQIYALGTASYNGFVFTISYFIKNITRGDYPSFILKVYNLISQTDSIWVKILFSGTKANAYVSCFWFFYLDGRCLGIIIGMLVYGLLCSLIYHLSKNTKNIRLISLFFIILQGLIFSFIRFPFTKIYYALAIIIIIIAYKKQEPRKGLIRNARIK